jgi:hypothetical protein
MEVYGVPATAGLRAALAEFGVASFQETPSGFRCTRVLNGAA